MERSRKKSKQGIGVEVMLTQFIKNLAKEPISASELMVGDNVVAALLLPGYYPDWGEDFFGIIVKVRKKDVVFKVKRWEGYKGEVVRNIPVDRGSLIGAVVGRLVSGKKRFFTVVE